jgi:nitrile hydratase
MSDDQHDHFGNRKSASAGFDPAMRVKAIEALLVEKGIVDPQALDSLIDTYEHKIGPHYGARVVARAWSNPAYKKRLLNSAAEAITELGIVRGPEGVHIKVLENTDKIHNLVVCTLCSCYPTRLLGLPPVWYKSFAYRSRAVSEPRAVLKEFGLELPRDTEIRVWDSSSEMRYLVLPQRPSGTRSLSEAELALLVTRDTMIGTAVVSPPVKNASRGAKERSS